MKITRTSVFALALLTNAAFAAELYVAPFGADSSSGTKDAPLATLDGARRAIATLELAGKEPVSVWVDGGTYSMDQALRFGASDSGTAQAPVSYRAAPGEDVKLKGSLPVDPNGWTLWKDGIYQQSLKGTALEGRAINQLFLSDQRMVRARFPNWDYHNPLRFGNGYLRATNAPSMKEVSADSEELKQRMARWKNPQAGIVHAFHVNNWGNFQFRIQELDSSSGTIHFGEGGWQAQRRYGVGAGHKNKDGAGSPFYIENILEELDAPFE